MSAVVDAKAATQEQPAASAEADAKAARRAEIMANIAAAKAAEEQKTSYFGTHDGISCKM